MRASRWIAALVVLLGATGIGSYKRASATAAALLCGTSTDLERVAVYFGPQRVRSGQVRLAWTFSYGPVAAPRDEGFQLVLSPTGELVGLNPIDLQARIDAWRSLHGARCNGTA